MKFLRNHQKPPYRKAVVLYSRKRLRIYPKIVLVHAHKDGGPVLRDESSWRTVSGVLVNTRWGYAIVQYRGFSH